MKYYRLIDDVAIPRRWHLGEVVRGGRAAVNLLNGAAVSTCEPLSVSISHFGRPLEFCLTSFAVPIATKLLCEVVSRIAGPDVQMAPIMVGSDEGFNVLNCTRLLTCVDEDRSRFTKWTPTDYRPDLAGKYKVMENLILQLGRIPPEVHMFRIDGWEVALVVSGSLMQAMLHHGCVGAKFVPIATK